MAERRARQTALREAICSCRAGDRKGRQIIEVPPRLDSRSDWVGLALRAGLDSASISIAPTKLLWNSARSESQPHLFDRRMLTSLSVAPCGGRRGLFL